MKKILVCLVFLILIVFKKSLAQSKDSCDIWKNYIGSINKKFDTVKVNIRYLAVTENIYHHPYSSSDKNSQFYQSLERRFNGLTISLEFELVDCNSRGYNYPIAYNKKYDYKLFHRKNKDGKYEDWDVGQILQITLVRYNRYFEDGKELITIVTEIKPM